MTYRSAFARTPFSGNAALRGYLADAAENSVKYARRHMRLLGWTAIISLMSYYFIWTAIFPEDYENVWVRTIGCAMWIPLFFHDRWNPRYARALPAYWLATLTFILPFVFGFMLAQNAAHADQVGQTNLIWPLQNVVALVIFMMLVNNGLISTTLWACTTVVIVLSLLVLPDTPNWEEVRRVYIEPTPLYGFILVVGSLAIRNREIIDQEKLAAVSAVGATIAHELRTPILGIKSLAEGIESFLPTLISGYNAAVANGIQVEPIRTRHLAALRTSLQQIKEETDYSNQVIGMLLINSSQQPLRGLEFELLSARECVETAVFRFPFSNKKERESLDTLIENDFEVRAPEVLIVHVLFNLIKNAIYYVDKAGGGAIRIRVRASTREIIVEDEGTGITADNLPKIFDRFFTTTTTGHGSGIGLSFCRMVMQEIGGAIACDSVPGQYTRFTLSFPAAGGTE